MTRIELQTILDDEHFNRRWYSLDGGSPNDTLCIDSEGNRLVDYYSERGTRFDEAAYASETEACAELLERLRALPESQSKRVTAETKSFSNLPDWAFAIDQISAGVYEAVGTHWNGAKVSVRGYVRGDVLEQCKLEAEKNAENNSPVGNC